LEPIVERLASLIERNGWRTRFEEAVAQLRAQRVASLQGIRELGDYFAFLDDMVRWAPRENTDSLLVHDKLVAFHFLLDQPAVRGLQNRIEPSAGATALTPLSQWIADFARTWGAYLDTPASAAHVESFRTNAAFRWDDYMPPPSGYLTFNQFFARHVKPGKRPIDAPCDPRIVVSPADASFVGQWRIDADSAIVVDDARLTLKHLRWSLLQLLDSSPYAERFTGGVVTHSALRTFDYHRWHAPLEGEVIEARSIGGQAFLDVEVVERVEGGATTRDIEAVEGTGYQFLQTRGLVVLRTHCGLVACLPVGMAQVSSVVITAEIGARLRKGEEMGYFQFGGSDFVMVFQACCSVELESGFDEQRQQGRRIGTCGA
jgi:phosphatidylserine decarboxylase